MTLKPFLFSLTFSISVKPVWLVGERNPLRPDCESCQQFRWRRCCDRHFVPCMTSIPLACIPTAKKWQRPEKAENKKIKKFISIENPKNYFLGSHVVVFRKAFRIIVAKCVVAKNVNGSDARLIRQSPRIPRSSKFFSLRDCFQLHLLHTKIDVGSTVRTCEMTNG